MRASEVTGSIVGVKKQSTTSASGSGSDNSNLAETLEQVD